MSADGVWRMEQHSSDGWEPAGTAFLENGRYLRGGADAYTVGTYEVDGDQISVTATTNRFGTARPVYGKEKGEIAITLKGQLKDGEMTAEATDGKFVTHYRYTRLADMP